MDVPSRSSWSAMLTYSGDSTDTYNVAPNNEDSSNASQNAQNKSLPLTKCPKCSHNCKNKCIRNTCLHEFWYTCLLQWNKIKSACYLCYQYVNQFFKFLIDNFQSDDDHGSPKKITPEAQSVRIIQPQTVDVFRSNVYKSNLWASHLPDELGCFLKCSAKFYEKNPGQKYELCTWLYRELNVLFSHQTDISHVKSVVLDLISLYDIDSSAFRMAIWPYFTNFTDHFTHEFYVFARSPYNMVGYDQRVSYVTKECIDENARTISSDATSAHQNNGSNGNLTVDLNSLGIQAAPPTNSAAFRMASLPYFSFTDPLTHVCYVIARSPYNMAGYDKRVSYVTKEYIIGNTHVLHGENVRIISSDATSAHQNNGSNGNLTHDSNSLGIQAAPPTSNDKPPHDRTPELILLDSDDDNISLLNEPSTSRGRSRKQKSVSISKSKAESSTSKRYELRNICRTQQISTAKSDSKDHEPKRRQLNSKNNK
ncbi:E3 ubiquitin-protein ligase Topors-like [Ctenocephalides felis]|uniref:E3 ubiquitin-protein ligase Topors-like n=1 Tax=Ctenocephalides felis TaxID=7515 RepID=UPI000E6E4AB8|nr:E3 ubiquitin-protein ligase Topors-like [Ctenocephalides felis]